LEAVPGLELACLEGLALKADPEGLFSAGLTSVAVA